MPQSKGSILYVGGFELPDKNPAAHRVINNAKIFRELGYKVIFAGVDKSIAKIAETENVMGFDSRPIPYPKTSKQWIKQLFDKKIYCDIIENYGDIKIVVCYNLHALPLYRLLKYCKKNEIKIVADSTEWYENRFSFNPVKLIKCLDTFLCMRLIQKKCDGMIAISTYLERYYKKYIKDVITVPPLVDLRDEKFAINNHKKSDKSVTFVYSGSPSAAKESLGEVVSAFQGLDYDFKLNIVGITKEQFYEIYHFIPADSKIDFLGKMSHSDSLEEVKRCDFSIIIRPKTRVTMAGFPTKFVESVACATPVIVNDFSDVKEYVKNFNIGFVLEDYENLFKFINEMSENEILSLKEKCKATKVFDYREYIDKFDSFLINIIC